jgi:hypothetical protein
VFPDPLVAPDVVPSFVLRCLFHRADPAHQDLPDRQAETVPPETLVAQDHQDAPATPDSQDPQAHRDPAESQEARDHRDRQETPADRPRAHRTFPANRDSQESPALRVCPATKDVRDQMLNLARPVNKAHLDRQGLLAKTASLATTGPEDRPAHRANAVFARNIVLWMAVSFSRMALEGNKR